MLGNMYARGWGVEQVYAKASHWWRKAAEQGNAYAQFNLGDMYFLGSGSAAGSRQGSPLVA